MISLHELPIRYEELNRLYEHCDQKYCLNALPTPLDEMMTRSYFLMVRTGRNNGNPFLCRGIFLDGTLIGKIELTKEEDGSAELDLIMDQAYENRGYGSEALRRMIDLSKDTGFCDSICAYVQEENEAMKRVLEKNGFEAVRPFKADVMTPLTDGYRLRTVSGREYMCTLQRSET